MSVDVRIIRPRDFIRSTAEGDLDLESSRRILKELAAIIEAPEDLRLLIDTRNASVKLSVPELFFLGDAVASDPRLFRTRTALLGSIRQAENDRFIEMVAQNRGANLKAFTSFENAIDWLVFDRAEDQSLEVNL